MKNKSLVFGSVAVVVLGAAVVGGVAVMDVQSPKAESVSIGFDWNKDVEPISLKLPVCKMADFEIVGGMSLCSAFPCALNISDRYFRYLRLRFEGRGRKGNGAVDLVSEAIVRPSIGKGETLVFRIADVVSVSSLAFDAKGEKLNCDLKDVDNAIQAALGELQISLPSIAMPYASIEVIDEQLWLNNDGLECRAFVAEK